MLFIPKTSNKKTGPIPVSYSPEDTCPSVCVLKESGCYAKYGPTSLVWKKHSQRLSYEEFIKEIKELPNKTFWRGNVAGDLQGKNNKLDIDKLNILVEANKGKIGYTYTHYPLYTAEEKTAIRDANKKGFTINLSANNLRHADELVKLKIAPVAVLVDSEIIKNFKTPEGNNVIICPAITTENMTCDKCRMCARPNRKSIIGFPSHGSGKKKANNIVGG